MSQKYRTITAKFFMLCAILTFDTLSAYAQNYPENLSCEQKYKKAWEACNQKYNGKCKYLGASFKPSCTIDSPSTEKPHIAGDASDSIELLLNNPIAFNKPEKTCRSEICTSLLSAIENANHTIDFAIYGMRGQPEILEALIKANKRGVKVRGIVDKDIKNKSYYKDTDKLIHSLNHVRTDYDSDLATLAMLKNKGSKYKKKCRRPDGYKGPLQCFEGKGYASKGKIHFKGDIMHNKFFIIDNNTVWTGSANISDTGTGGYNANISTLIKSNFIAHYYTIEFNQMYELGRHHRQKKILRKANLTTVINNKDVSLYFSPQGYAMYRGVIPLIKRAKNTIDIAVFFLTHKNVSLELVKAKERGVKVRIILDATAATNGYSKHNYLRKHGIQVKVESWGGKMHMKSAIIDSSHLIIGSMNWTSAGESKNDENTIIIKNSGNLGLQYSVFFSKLWESIPNKWLYEDPNAESLDSINSCTDGIDNDFDHQVDDNDISCRK